MLQTIEAPSSAVGLRPSLENGVSSAFWTVSLSNGKRVATLFRNKQWLQISLRTLLILFTCVAIASGWFAYYAHQRTPSSTRFGFRKRIQYIPRNFLQQPNL